MDWKIDLPENLIKREQLLHLLNTEEALLLIVKISTAATGTD